MSIPFIGQGSRAASRRARAAVSGITGSPQAMPVFTALPGSWSPTINVRGFSAVEWAVFQVSTDSPPRYTSSMVPVRVNAPAGAGSQWSFTPSAVITGPRDRLIVKNTFNWPAPPDVKEWISDGAVVNLPAPTGMGGNAMARAFVSDLTVGMNIERGEIVWQDYITTGRLQQWKDLGLTHVRFFPPVGGRFGQGSADDLGWMFDAIGKALGVGFKVPFDLLDVMGAGDMEQGWIMPYLARCGELIAARGWDVSRYAVGAAQEYAWDTNQRHRAKMHEAVATLRSKLPNSLLVCAGAMWNDPGCLLGDSLFESQVGSNEAFVPPPNDDRILVQWHKYDDYAHTDAGAKYWQPRLAAWATANNLVTFCGEWQRAPADGGLAQGDPGIVGRQEYLMWPEVIGNADHMWQQCVTFWTACGDSNAWWRANEYGSAKLFGNVETALTAANTAIRAKPEWVARRDAAAGAGQQPGEPGPPPTGAQVSSLEVFCDGQSNLYFADAAGAPTRLRETLEGLAGLPVKVISRKETPDDSTIHSGSWTYWRSPYNQDPRWLEPPNNNYGSDPATWGNNDQMQGALNAVSRNVSGDSKVPLLNFSIHWEYDLKIEEGSAKAAYPNGSWEKVRRIRAVRAKDPGKHVLFRGYCPYPAGGFPAAEDIRRSWLADLGNASRNVVMACGQMMDASDRGDGSHWTDEAGPRIFPRVAFNMAVHAWRQGWLPSNIDLSDCPSMGPRIVSAVRSGNSIVLTIAHDKGTSLVAGSGGIDWRSFTRSPGEGHESTVDATGGAITGANTIRVDFSSPPPDGGRVWHTAAPWHRDRQVIRDNWHTVRPAKYGGVPNIGAVEFPLQRTLAGIAYT